MTKKRFLEILNLLETKDSDDYWLQNLMATPDEIIDRANHRQKVTHEELWTVLWWSNTRLKDIQKVTTADWFGPGCDLCGDIR